MIATDRPLAIIAGGGSVPTRVATAAMEAGRPLFVVGIEGEADPGIEGFPHAWVGWGSIGRLERLLAAHGTKDLVLVGNIKLRPDFKRLKPYFGTIKTLPEIASILIGGDNSVLTGVIRFMETRGYTIVGAHEIATDLVAELGPVAGRSPREAEMENARIALEAARTIGELDAGQAAVSSGKHVIALEAAEGTDAMLERVASLKQQGRLRRDGPVGVLAKCAKPQQDLRVDMPTIGPRTVEGVVKAGLAGIAIEARHVMIVDRDEVVKLARDAGIFIVALDLARR